ncbi:hypothetical protein vBPmiSPMCJR_025 [Proteus phage vB_PmiS_PM-CJR]|nr:hypothetical protein vBPmiSPMCJR_025 [Proteus phage vB_PmiS_PM-CJR]
MTLLEWLESNRGSLEDGVYLVGNNNGIFRNGQYVKYSSGKCQYTTDKYKVENGVITLIDDCNITLLEWLVNHSKLLENGKYMVDGRGVIFHNNKALHQKQSVFKTNEIYEFCNGNLYHVLGNDKQLMHSLNKSASEYLEEGAKLLKERGKQYDKSGEERSMEKIVKIFNLQTGQNLSVVEGWYFMQVLKDVRFFQNTEKPHEDSLVDGINYRALMTEEAMRK